ncbi:MAG TPA: hypothetical protein VGM10_34020 [Actinocrinis sp.]|jgi:hypothetical protein
MSPASQDGAALADRLLAALADAQRSGNPIPSGDPERWRRIIRIAMHRWRTFPLRHPGPVADTLAARSEDLARGLLDRVGRAPGAPDRPDIAACRALAVRLAVVLAQNSGPRRGRTPRA